MLQQLAQLTIFATLLVGMVSRIDTAAEAAEAYIDYNAAMTNMLTALTLFTTLVSVPLAVLERIAEPGQAARKYARTLMRARKGALKGVRGLANAARAQRHRSWRGGKSGSGGTADAPADKALEAVLPGWARFEFELSSESDVEDEDASSFNGGGSLSPSPSPSDDDGDGDVRVDEIGPADQSADGERALFSAAAAFASDPQTCTSRAAANTVQRAPGGADIEQRVVDVVVEQRQDNDAQPVELRV